MTTEYVSVPREFLAVLEAKISRWRYLASENASGTEGELSFNVTLHSCARELEAILSRATPSDDSAELNYAKSLATSMWEKHYAKDAPNWELCDDLYGVLSQIDNMLTGLSREKTSSPRVVTDEDVERACQAFFVGNVRKPWPWRDTQDMDEPEMTFESMRDAIQADRQRGGGVIPSERIYAPLPSDADEYDRGHVDGWNACRQALLDQRGQVREGFVLVPVEPTEAILEAMFEECDGAYCTASSIKFKEVYKAMLAAVKDEGRK